MMLRFLFTITQIFKNIKSLPHYSLRKNLGDNLGTFLYGFILELFSSPVGLMPTTGTVRRVPSVSTITTRNN